jgi:hypothetical protein
MRFLRGSVFAGSVASALAPAAALAFCLYDVPGDINNDGAANVADVNCIILAAIAEVKGDPVPSCVGPGGYDRTDIDANGLTQVKDIQFTVLYSLDIPIPAYLDVDQDGCPDSAEGCAGDGDCDDGDPCTADACVDGVCWEDAPEDCDDGDPCTSDTCDPVDGCIHEGSCGGLCIAANGVTSSKSDCNVAGTTLIPTSVFLDPNPPAGWTQCAGFVNTDGDDVSANFFDNCLNTNRLRIRVWGPGGALEEDVHSTDMSSWGAWPDFNYLGGSVTKAKATYWTGSTTYFTETQGGSACYFGGPGGTADAPSGVTLGTGNGSSAIIAAGNTNAFEWRVNCSGQALSGRSIALYK